MARSSLCCFIAIGLISAVCAAAEPDAKTADDVKLLLSRLDLSRPGLERVRAASDDPARAAGELLNYYRTRTGVKHPVDRQDRAKLKGMCASAEDAKHADDALKHVLLADPAYPPYFCGDDINWSHNPVPDKEWIWQLHRMEFWNAMARMYWHTGDEKYAREWCLQFADWVKKNPRDKQHADAWRSIEAGLRGYSWTEVYERFVDSPGFTPEILVQLLNSFHEHASYLRTKYSQRSNWGLIEAQGLFFIAMTFPEFQDAEAWRAEAVRRLVREIDSQVYADGHQRELTLDYHVDCILWFWNPLELANMNGREQDFPADYAKKVERMVEAVMKLGLPDGSMTQFGDAWAGEPGKTYTTLKQYAGLFRRDDFLYVATEGRQGAMPKGTAFALEQSGFYSMRSGWDKNAICLVLKCGPDGGWHCQHDNGTFELYAGGRHLMPDSGSYIYSGNDVARRWFQQTRVHQTLTLDNKISAYAPRLLLWKPGDDLDTLVVENASYPGLTHRRAVFFVRKKVFVLVDEAVGEATGNLNLHFQLAPGKAVFDAKNLAVRTDFADGWNVLVRGVEQKGMTLNEEEGQVSFVYGKKEPRPAFAYAIEKEKADEGVRFFTLVAPYAGAEPNVNVELVGRPAVGASRVELDVRLDGQTIRIGYDLPGSGQ
jgi:heparan-sulfate lyase